MASDAFSSAGTKIKLVAFLITYYTVCSVHVKHVLCFGCVDLRTYIHVRTCSPPVTVKFRLAFLNNYNMSHYWHSDALMLYRFT